MGSFMDTYNSQINPRSMQSAPSTGTDTGFGMDWLNNNAEGLGIVSQLGGLGLAGYDTFFGGTAKINDLKIEGLKQQIANNKQSMVDRKTFNKNWADASNGLAASQVV